MVNRSDRPTLLEHLEVHLKDPVIDWLGGVKRKETEGDEEEEEVDEGADGANDDEGVSSVSSTASSGRGRKRRLDDTDETESAASKGSKSKPAGKSSQSKKNEEKQGKGENEPLRKIQNALRKLEGHNPVDILLNDIQHNKVLPQIEQSSQIKDIISKRGVKLNGGGKWFEAIAEAARGKEEYGQYRYSARMRTAGGRGLSVDDQIDCLVELATDPNVLVRQYAGLVTMF